MRIKKLSVLCGFTALLLAGLGGFVAVLLKHEPSFFERADVEASAERKHLSGQFVSQLAQLMADVSGDRGRWAYSFSEAQVNSFFCEDFVNYGEADNLRKLHISDPRVAIEDGRIRLAFRYGRGPWNTVLSYDLRVWIVPKEPNVVAVEILGRRAGALPISSQTLISELAELASRHGIEVSAYRHDGHPVALLRFEAERPRPRMQLQGLKLSAGNLTIAGTSAEAAQQSVQPLKSLRPAAN